MDDSNTNIIRNDRNSWPLKTAQELRLNAHLRGAIALIIDKRAKKLPESQSSMIYNAVENQIVCFFSLVHGCRPGSNQL